MHLIIAILLYLGAITSPEQASRDIIDQNQGQIDQIMANPQQLDGIVVGMNDDE